MYRVWKSVKVVLAPIACTLLVVLALLLCGIRRSDAQLKIPRSLWKTTPPAEFQFPEVRPEEALVTFIVDGKTKQKRTDFTRSFNGSMSIAPGKWTSFRFRIQRARITIKTDLTEGSTHILVAAPLPTEAELNIPRLTDKQILDVRPEEALVEIIIPGQTDKKIKEFKRTFTGSWSGTMDKGTGFIIKRAYITLKSKGKENTSYILIAPPLTAMPRPKS